MKSEFVKALENEDEVRITVKGRTTGREITLPVWFVCEGSTLSLLPVEGSSTNWFLNLQKNPELALSVGKKSIKVMAELYKDPKSVRETTRRFEEKYGKDEIAKWYSKFDVCLKADLGS